MNALFHTATAIGVAVMLTDTKKMELTTSAKPITITSIFAFIVGIISHAALDYIPHCYPINSKLDVILGSLLIGIMLWFANKKYRLILALSFLGCIFPDLIDLLPSIINKQFGLNMPTTNKIFPWHFPSYSGSIYNNNCSASTINQTLLICTICIVCWFRQTDFKVMFAKKLK